MRQYAVKIHTIITPLVWTIEKFFVCRFLKLVPIYGAVYAQGEGEEKDECGCGGKCECNDECSCGH